MASSPSAPRDLEQIVRDGLSSLVFAFGFQSGIIEAFINTEQPCSAEELCEKAKTKLRYTQEWLGCMVAAGIVIINEDGKYSLPYKSGQLKAIGHISTVIPVLSETFPQLLESIKPDGPAGFWYTEPFLKWLDASRSQEDLVMWVTHYLAPVMKLKPGNGFTILDFGCGFGKYTIEIAKLYPDSKVYAIDMDQISIDNAKERLACSTDGPKNVDFVCVNGGELPENWMNKFDFVIINDVLHDSFNIDQILEEIKRVVKPDGYAAAFDPAVSSYHGNLTNDKSAQMLLPLSLFSCLPVSSIKSSEEGLGMGWGYERRKQKIEEHGFRVVPVGDCDVNTIQETIVFQKA